MYPEPPLTYCPGPREDPLGAQPDNRRQPVASHEFRDRLWRQGGQCPQRGMDGGLLVGYHRQPYRGAARPALRPPYHPQNSGGGLSSRAAMPRRFLSPTKPGISPAVAVLAIVMRSPSSSSASRFRRYFSAAARIGMGSPKLLATFNNSFQKSWLSSRRASVLGVLG